MFNKRAISAIFFFLLVAEVLLAQKKDYNFRHISVKDGLSNNSVIAIEQDKLGQMWLGTRNGLNLYNGTEFKVFKHVPTDSTSLSNNDILSINEDSDGYLWVGTYRGLNRYDPINNIFKRYLQNPHPNSLGNNVIICSLEMPDGEIWFGTANGISIYNKSNDNFTLITYEEGKANGLPFKNVQRIFLDSRHQIWVATAGGLAKLEKRVKNEFIFKQYPFKDGDIDLFIQDLIEPSPNVLGLATKYNGYLLFDTKKEKYVTPPETVLPISADVRVLQQANDQSIWLGTTQGIRIIGAKNEIIDIISKESSLSQNFIKTVFKDRHGTIWLGTYSGGVNIWDPSNENFTHLKNEELANPVVTAIIGDKHSNLVYGTEGGDVAIYNPKKNTSRVYNLSDKENLIPNSIQTLLLSDSDILWAGVLNYGLIGFDLQSHQLVENFLPKKLREYLKTTGVFSIVQGKNGIYWIGTFGKGLVRYDTQTRQFRTYGKWTKNKPKLTSNIVKTICIDQSGNIWAGGLGGLNLLKFINEEKDDYEVYHFFSGAYSGNDIKTIFEDKNGIIWVGTKTLAFSNSTARGSTM